MSQGAQHRAQALLLETGREYPGAWQAAETFRGDKGSPGFEWPDWCYMPLAASHAVVSMRGGIQNPLELVKDCARVGAMMAWRMTQGIYRFDPAVYQAVRDTPVAGDLPCDILMRLPEWCVYVETPDFVLSAERLHGFFAHLEHDMNTQRPELRFLLDTETDLIPIPLHLGPWSIELAIERSVDVAIVNGAAIGQSFDSAGARGQMKQWAEPLMSLLLYLCSSADFSRNGVSVIPANPAPKKTKRGQKLFPANRLERWEVGVRMGAALRAAYAQQETSQGRSVEAGARPRAHIRRAHWHTILRGPRTGQDGSEIPTHQRKRDLRWMPPIPVNVEGLEDLPAVIRPVR